MTNMQKIQKRNVEAINPTLHTTTPAQGGAHSLLLSGSTSVEGSGHETRTTRKRSSKKLYTGTKMTESAIPGMTGTEFVPQNM